MLYKIVLKATACAAALVWASSSWAGNVVINADAHAYVNNILSFSAVTDRGVNISLAQVGPTEFQAKVPVPDALGIQHDYKVQVTITSTSPAGMVPKTFCSLQTYMFGQVTQTTIAFDANHSGFTAGIC